MSRPTLFAEKHRARGARLVDEDGWLLPARFGPVDEEYRAVRSACGFFDLCHYAVVRLAGPDRASFLQGMVSNDVKKLAPGEGVHAAALDVNGKVLADLRVLCAEGSFILLLRDCLKQKLLDQLNRYLVADDVTIDADTAYGMISVQGPHALLLLDAAAPHQEPPVRMYGHALLRLDGRETRVVRTTHTGEEGFDVLMELQDAVPAAEALERAGSALGARWIGLEAQEILRVEAGLPRYGVDMDEENILLETGLDDAVSFSKGCYLGQEVVERIHSRGHVNRKLSGLLLDGKEPAARGDTILADAKEIGRITSSVFSPKLSRPIALAYLHRDYLRTAMDVTVRTAKGEIPGTVATLPFVYETSP